MPGWWFEICFYVHPENWGFMIQFDEHIVQNDGLKSPARYNSANGCSCNMMYISIYYTYILLFRLYMINLHYTGP